jgi:hypothetical protein
MRKVSTSRISNSSPALMFSRGVEQIVSDHMERKQTFDDQELLAMQGSAKKPAGNDSLFSTLIQQLFWPRAGRRA